ncbi:glycosyltransferase family 2 protein [Roseivirga misakiensis]|uniref:Glycosyl transferase n=1 Tax=Roseivirga misakiensis TaxID=1563681 RepID=A0A1E5T1W2_9BACT|nr:glycosyltransferase family 2 protein [Roseivirga misakiensis]OEK05362.1 glycosyl transferase [Roseivirga misakiensis]
MSKPVKISGVIITFNEERNIERCLTSLKEVCDEIVVVDSFSTDGTKAICQAHQVRFVENTFEGHIEQKNFAMAQATNDIVLSLDADEALSPKLQESILAVKQNWQQPAYRFNRFTNYCGQWIKHSGWYPDTKTRLWDRRNGKWGGTNPHDSVELSSNIEAKHLKGDLLHYSYYTMEEHVLRSAKYAKISAKALYKQGKKASLLKMIGSAGFRFVQDYFLRGGIRDGFYGLVICGTSSHTTFLKYAYLRNLNNGKAIEE